MQILTVGFLTVDMIVADLPETASQGKVVYAPKGIQLCVGDHPANVSIDLRQLGVQRKQIGLIGAIGKDFCGQFIRKTWKKNRITTCLQVVENIGTT